MNSNDYKARHALALETVQLVGGNGTKQSRQEMAIVAMLKGLMLYEENFTCLANDHVLGDYWCTIAHALRGLLNGELGRLDGGLTDKAICEALESAGFNPDVEGERK